MIDFDPSKMVQLHYLLGGVPVEYSVYEDMWSFVVDNYLPRLYWFPNRMHLLAAGCEMFCGGNQGMFPKQRIHWRRMINEGKYAAAEELFWTRLKGSQRLVFMVEGDGVFARDVFTSNWKDVDEWGLLQIS